MNDFPWGDFATCLAASAGAALAVLLAAFAAGAAKGLHRVVDVAWGTAFAGVAAVSYALSAGHGDEGRRLLVLIATAAWGLRLSVHIGLRGWGHGEDPRYDRLLSRAPGSRNLYALRMVYLLQAVLVWVVSLPVQFAMYVPGALNGFASAGVALWLVGFFFESVGDFQLARFKRDPAHRGAIMDRGLWSWTRHPNYFGDFCVWWGLFLLACSTPLVVVTLVSPLVMSFLLLRGSGKPMLERHMERRPGFAEYTARTSGFFPRPPRHRS
ncbi:DUF1295 domain-containing protein [Streptomyces sp. SID13666]|uniref:DUF1295 domain-containing protein n=1 Tax=Streptomyces TaxID=1883 RepID=UPI00110629B7|nr:MULTISPECIES: DUF1295 domain-containing protein [Streptomyces]MCZ4099202.1 DUF1295 domain-containing protein [Streptomyces sp. H39-C1]NEA56013.1 DUF1295 domain-containing protein [Streptomyces sp. SID13666]NEA72006.1 DUF1295 domain-containing protein [Streptomyces sp. SID13588]QNA72215.1 DUF1295 domain-containing protein [Streptomyces sp. So13.3]